jgi:hypothetical protein
MHVHDAPHDTNIIPNPFKLYDHTVAAHYSSSRALMLMMGQLNV